ncbi:hypothetical protein DPMN_072575 [Dreissena polymorpha]|uniref:Uncharacterized protein n=1 Tax=Dreissena polymorpha TaxID=45954 RepID=A0A9D4BXJ7_DREPO|nr:hypothetical protein DPMN_072575 [Dreissena polymorpha]
MIMLNFSESLNSCSVHCANGCDSTGNFSGCLIGYYGEFRNELCPSHCLGGCNRSTAGCNVSCSLDCKGQICYQTTGACIECTADNMFGEMCSEKCSHNCLHSACMRDHGQCTHGCELDNYGPNCDQMCPMTGARRHSSFRNRCSVEGD